jgi:hypothetical protein
MHRQVAQAYAGACGMIVRRDGNNIQCAGTGFLCHTSGYILTSAHILSMTDKLAFVPAPPIATFNPTTVSQVQFFPVIIAHMMRRTMSHC